MKIKCFNSTNYFKTLYNVEFFTISLTAGDYA